MNLPIFSYRRELPEDEPVIEALHAEVFGPGRFARAAFRLREGVPHHPDLSFVAMTEGRVIASVRLTPIRIGTVPALLLGPLVVEPAFKGRGAGKALTIRGLPEEMRQIAQVSGLTGLLPLRD